MNKNILLTVNVRSLDDDELFRRAYDVVSSYRKKDVDRHRNRINKNLSLATELLLKHGYALLGEDIDLETIVYGGKPYIDNQHHFNFSHSGEYAICAISSDEVGCDIEAIGKYNNAIAKRFYHENEYANLASLCSEAEQIDLFYRYWTAKEAFVKNIGTGIKTPLNSFEIVIGDSINVKQSINNQSYYFKSFEMEDYALCVCSLNNEDIELIHFNFTLDTVEKLW